MVNRNLQRLQGLLTVKNAISFTVMALALAIIGISFGYDTRLEILPILFMGFGGVIIANSIAGTKLQKSLSGDFTRDDFLNIFQGGMGLAIFLFLGVAGLSFVAERAGNLIRNVQSGLQLPVAIIMLVVAIIVYIRDNQ